MKDLRGFKGYRAATGLGLVAALLIAGSASANWQGTVDSSWANSANWSFRVPLATDVAYITYGANDPEISAGTSAQCATLELPAYWMGAGSVTMTLSGGTLSIANAIDCGTDSNHDSTLLLAGGEVTCSTINIGANSRVDITEGQLTITGSTLAAVSLLVDDGKIISYSGAGSIQIASSGSDLILTAGQGDGMAQLPDPANFSWGIPSGSPVQLSWTAGTGALSHDIYLSTNAADVINGSAFQVNQAGTIFTSPDLAPDAAYYWRVDEVTASTVNQGVVWSFRTDNRGRYELSEEELDLYFSDPPNEFRIVKYQLNNSHLVEYPQYGFGGYKAFFYNNLYLHGPTGPDAIGPLVDSANAQGRTVWSADDNGYPSASAGGLVVENNPEYEVRGVAMLASSGSGQVPVSISTPPDCEKMVSAVLYPVAGGVPDYSQGQVQSVLDTGVNTTGLAGDWTLRAFVLQIRDSNTQAQTTTNQFGTTGHYPDLLNSNAVASWISLVHEPVLAEISDPAAQLEGFYFNEPSLMQLNWNDPAPYACLSWNADIFNTFQSMHGYDLEPVMAALYDRDDLYARRVRMHFHQAVGEQLQNSFTGQISEWCGRRGIAASGHPLIEESLPIHVANYGDMMKVVAKNQVPAVDLPMPEPEHMASENYHFPKLMSSMGSWNEVDRRVIGLLDPIIGGYGLNRLTPSEDVLCNTVNRAARSGVNLFTTYIPLDGYGGTAVFEQVNEYTGRLSSMLTGARIASSVALYYPIEMFQMDYKPTTATHWGLWNPSRQVAWDTLQKTMLNADVDFNIVHPEWVRDAEIEDGELQIGSGSYRYLVMPDVELISSNVLARVQQFEAAGGTVLWVDSKPQAGAYPSEDAHVTAAVSGYTTVPAAQVPGLITNPYDEQFQLRVTSGSVLTTRFSRQDRGLYFLINPAGTSESVHIEDGNAGAVKVYDPVTGDITVTALPADIVVDAYRSVLISTLPMSSLVMVRADGAVYGSAANALDPVFAVDLTAGTLVAAAADASYVYGLAANGDVFRADLNRTMMPELLGTFTGLSGSPVGIDVKDGTVYVITDSGNVYKDFSVVQEAALTGTGFMDIAAQSTNTFRGLYHNGGPYTWTRDQGDGYFNFSNNGEGEALSNEDGGYYALRDDGEIVSDFETSEGNFGADAVDLTVLNGGDLYTISDAGEVMRKPAGGSAASMGSVETGGSSFIAIDSVSSFYIGEESAVADGSFENPPGTDGVWRECHTNWNPTTTGFQYQILNPIGTHFDAAADGDWCALISSIGTIHQNFDVAVNAGDTLSVTFYGGRSKDISNTSGGGIFNAAFKVGSSTYSLSVNTTGQTQGTWQDYTHTVTVANSGLLGIEFSAVNGSPWLDHISEITIIRGAMADFSAAPTSGYAPLQVVFSDTSSFGGGSLTNRVWTFGDGSTTNTSAAGLTHRYSSPGLYTVQLTVNGTGGSSTATQSNLVSVLAVPPPGFDPVNPGGIDPVTGEVTLRIETLGGLQYRVVYQDDLTDTNDWQAVTPPEPEGWIIGDGFPAVIMDADATNAPQRFYRVESKSVGAE